MAKHEKAFDKGTDEDKLKATSEQVQEQTGQADAPEAGPDPIVEATKDIEQADIPDQVQVQEDLEKEQAEAEKADDA